MALEKSNGTITNDRRSDSSSKIAFSPAQVRIAVCLALSLLAIVSLFPYLQTGYTTTDDTEFGLWGGRPDLWLETATNFAANQGRFYQLFTVLGNCLVHYPTSRVYYYSLNLGSILLNVAVFYCLLRTVFRSSLLPVLGAALSLAYLQNNWQHSLLTSYPVMPTLGLTNLFLAGIFFHKWQESQGLRFAILAGVTYFLSILEYEVFLPYFVVFLGIAIYGAWSVPHLGLTQRAWVAVKALSPIVTAVVVYLAWYVIYRLLHPVPRYGGTELALGDLWKVVAVIWQYTSSTLPGYFYFWDDPNAMAVTYDGFGVHVRGISGLLDRCRSEWLVKAVVASTICLLILLQQRRIFTTKAFCLAVAGGFACVVAPVLLLGFTVKYQDWVLKSGSQAYVPSYYSYFATIFLISAVLLFLNQKIARWRVLSVSFVMIASGAVGIASLATDYYNYYITLDQQLSHLKWRAVGRFIQTDDFEALRDDSIIFAPTLWRQRAIVGNHETYWSDYLTQKSGKRISVAHTRQQFATFVSEKPDGQTYFLSFEQEPKEPNQFVVFSNLPDRRVFDGPVYSNEFALFTYSKNKSFTLIGECSPRSQPVEISINGQAVEEIEGSTFFARVDLSNTREDFPRTTVKSSVPIDVAHLVVSYFPVEPGRKGIEIIYGSGFHGLEQSAEATWNWSVAQSEINIVSYSEHPVEKSIQFQLIVFAPSTVSLQIGGIREAIPFEASGARLVNLTVVLQPGENKLCLTSNQPARILGTTDQRPMAFGVQNLRVTKPGR